MDLLQDFNTGARFSGATGATLITGLDGKGIEIKVKDNTQMMPSDAAAAQKSETRSEPALIALALVQLLQTATYTRAARHKCTAAAAAADRSPRTPSSAVAE